jgi:hypothetical protein
MPDLCAIVLTPGPAAPRRWLAPRLVRELEANLERGEQTLLFLNRRGYCPAHPLPRLLGTASNVPIARPGWSSTGSSTASPATIAAT